MTIVIAVVRKLRGSKFQMGALLDFIVEFVVLIMILKVESFVYYITGTEFLLDLLSSFCS